MPGDVAGMEHYIQKTVKTCARFDFPGTAYVYTAFR